MRFGPHMYAVLPFHCAACVGRKSPFYTIGRSRRGAVRGFLPVPRSNVPAIAIERDVYRRSLCRKNEPRDFSERYPLIEKRLPIKSIGQFFPSRGAKVTPLSTWNSGFIDQTEFKYTVVRTMVSSVTIRNPWCIAICRASVIIECNDCSRESMSAGAKPLESLAVSSYRGICFAAVVFK